MKSAPLAGKVILVMGGTSGIGLSAARAFLAAGARVVAVGRDEESSAAAGEALGRNGIVLTADATDPKSAAAAINVAIGNFGALHGLYHVAGGSGRRFGDGPLHEISDDGWEQTLRLNLTTVFFSNRAAVGQFLKQGTGGTVLNLSSVLAFSPAATHFSTHAYATAKAGIVGLTTASAAHYARENIRFNALAPSLVATPMSQRAQGNTAIMDFIRAKQPLDGGRIGRPEDLDAAAVFFMSEESRFVTGQVLAVDGGWSVSEGNSPTPSAPPVSNQPIPASSGDTIWRGLGRLWAKVKPKE
jgi:NAD(P)-dependent dehydrogenase (short-subunit alcohol dehydrogenase family)